MYSATSCVGLEVICGWLVQQAEATFARRAAASATWMNVGSILDAASAVPDSTPVLRCRS